MTAAQAHRGPDGHGFALFGKRRRVDFDEAPVPEDGDFLAFGHRRLAVIDLSEDGRQPMSSLDGRLTIIHNGEIYNYLELREDLRARGHLFATESDTEVILAAYDQWGLDCFSRFNGMWAFAIWDAPAQRLVLARDRFGVKPLHYANTARGLFFSSEIKGILAAGAVPPRMNSALAVDFLRYALVNHTEATLFDQIHSLPPGSYAVLHRPDDTLHPQKYWDIESAANALEAPHSFDEAANRLRDLLEQAVGIRLRSDIAVGSCLSGGLDSSSIVCAVARLRGKDGDAGRMTFTAVSENPTLDERAWAERVATHANADARYVSSNAQDFAAFIDRLIHQQDEPFTSGSILAQFRIMAVSAASGIHVLLDGQGADEILCGYRKYVPFYISELAGNGQFGGAARELGGLVLRGDRGTFNWREGKRYLPQWLHAANPGIASVSNPDASGLWSDRIVRLGGGKSVRKRQIADIQSFSLPSLLRYEDRNSMAFGVETRTPFLDYRLASYCVAMPSDFKISGGRTKAVLRKAMEGLVPQQVIDRRDKLGFTTDQDRWLRGPLAEIFSAEFNHLPDAVAELVDAARLGNAFKQFVSGNGSLTDAEFFRVFVLGRWVRQLLGSTA